MSNVHGVEFKDKQAELVKDLIRELLNDGECAIYAMRDTQSGGELRMASTPPVPGTNRDAGVFLRVRPGINAPTIIRPVNTKFGDLFIKLEKHTRSETLAIIRAWRRQMVPNGVQRSAPGPAAKTSLPGKITIPVPAKPSSLFLKRAS
jgi:hypothetical protein